MRLALDLSSIVWTGLRVGKDPEGRLVSHNGKSVLVNTAAYGYENVINSIVSCLNEWSIEPKDLLIVKEGMSSKAPRLAISRSYKANRDDKPTESYVEFQELRDKVTSLFKSLGSIVLTQDSAEGDDVLGWLAANAESDLVIQTNDGDMTVLSGKNSYGANVIVRVNGLTDVNKYGNFPHKYVTLYKATVGDSSDGITGIPGFGPKAWEQLWSRFGEAGCDYLTNLIHLNAADELFEDSRTDDFVKKLYDGFNSMVTSYKLARIYPEWVNTMNDPLKWEGGMCFGVIKDERLIKYSSARRLVTSDNWDSFMPWALENIKKNPRVALDIETSTPPESDDWLYAQDDANGVDTIGSELAGMSLTFGANNRYTVYMSVNHRDTNNISTDKLAGLLEKVFELGVKLDIHNTLFEGPVLHNLWGERWKANGYRGFLPNWYDTKFSASYMDENDSLGLKKLSKKWLNYDQTDYKTATSREGPFTEGTGGIVIGSKTVDGVIVETRQFKMAELTAAEVFDYASDDTMTTAALSNLTRTFLEFEHTLKVLDTVELDASYLHAQAFTTGTSVDLVKLQELIKEDRESYETSKLVLDSYLVSKGWEGTVKPEYTSELTAAQVKQAFQIVVGKELGTAVRTVSKLIPMVEEEDPLLAGALSLAVAGKPETLNSLITSRFTGSPVLNLGSPKQCFKLMYETMKLPVRVYNPPTAAMQKLGQRQGNPKTDSLAITYGLLDADEETSAALEALRIMKMVNTRFSLYYETLPGFVHWKTGRVHSSHNQCATNTRRASSSKPNLQQLSKNEKVEGYSPRVRELYVPHKKGAVIVSLDFSSQELLLMAEWSGDKTLISCFVGEVLTDMHCKTGVGIYNNLHGSSLVYEEFADIFKNSEHEEYGKVKKARALAKAVNFGGIYRIAAKKLSTMLLVIESEAQAMLDAKAEAFPQVEEWSQEEMTKVKGIGVVETMLGAKRHLRDQLMSTDRYTATKAPRQTLSYRIQGSAAEMTKCAEGRMWSHGVLDRYDCEYIAPVHDETVFSVMIEDLPEFLPEVHRLMTENYANMRLPIRSSVSFGPSFGVQFETGEDFSVENIQKILGKCRVNEVTV